jgi:hypothetical protein
MRRLIVLFLAVFAVPVAAFASDGFTDPRGDVSGDGPDITSVTLSHTDQILRIAVDFASTPPLGYDEDEQYTDTLLVGIHTDDDLGRDDVEFWTGVHGVDLTEAMVVRGEAGSGVVGSADVAVEGAMVTLEVERGLLDDPDEVAVTVAAGREETDEQAVGGGDQAPASGPYRYVLADGGDWWLWPLVAGGVAAAALAGFALVRGRRSAQRPAGPSGASHPGPTVGA